MINVHSIIGHRIDLGHSPETCKWVLQCTANILSVNEYELNKVLQKAIVPDGYFLIISTFIECNENNIYEWPFGIKRSLL